MLHRALLPGHARWSGFFSRLRFVIIDECHGYRGVFGSHVARCSAGCAGGGASRPPGEPRAGPANRPPAPPVFVLASATVGAPGVCARLLTGLDAEEVTEDGSPRGRWPSRSGAAADRCRGEAGARLRRTATAQAADLLGRLVAENVQTLAFIRSRRGAEAVALAARRSLDAHARNAGHPPTPATPRRRPPPDAGHPPTPAWRRSRLIARDTCPRTGGASRRRCPTPPGRAGHTTALELGVNITGLDAVLIAGGQGRGLTLAAGGPRWAQRKVAAAVLIARDDPLDTYLVRHPEILLSHPVEATVLDPGNPYVLAPHLCAAAAELALTEQDLEMFGRRHARSSTT